MKQKKKFLTKQTWSDQSPRDLNSRREIACLGEEGQKEIRASFSSRMKSDIHPSKKHRSRRKMHRTTRVARTGKLQTRKKRILVMIWVMKKWVKWIMT